MVEYIRLHLYSQVPLVSGAILCVCLGVVRWDFDEPVFVVLQLRTESFVDGSRTIIERRDSMNDEIDKDSLLDAGEDECLDFTFDFAADHDLLRWLYFSFAWLKNANGDGDLTGNDGSSTGSNLQSTFGSRTAFWKWDGTVKSFVWSWNFFGSLYKRCYKTLFKQFLENCRSVIRVESAKLLSCVSK